MDTELGSNASFVRRNFLQARELIKEGSTWQIGDGETMSVASHKWTPPFFKSRADQSLKVRSLFYPGTRQWVSIQSMFSTSIRDDISGIKLGGIWSRDNLCWVETKSKTFLVKSAYQVVLRLNRPPGGEHSMASQVRKLWKTLWTLHTPPKVRTFIWRACSNILPTRVNLLNQKVQIDPRYTICDLHDITTSHIHMGMPIFQERLGPSQR